jgi:hypothetical protein
MVNTAQIEPRLYPALQRICVDRPNLAKQIGSVKPGFRRHRLATQIPRRGDHSRDRTYLIQLRIRLAEEPVSSEPVLQAEFPAIWEKYREFRPF